ncbi:hypothetical protein [Chryseobacterium aquaticum]|jgi:hypothetical protein|uniref:hypothetical protein n=1 Tax=Chryseobacterium aquaticum TaxID=452084 RepID=UPI003F6FCEB4
MDNKWLKIPLYSINNFNYYQKKEVSLLREDENVFRIIEYGDFKPILNQGPYLLFENQLAQVFKNLASEQILRYNEVEIFRQSTKEKWNNYTEIVFKTNLQIDDFDIVDSTGLKVYSFLHESIYVTELLKNRIIESYSNADQIAFSNDRPFLSGN